MLVYTQEEVKNIKEAYFALERIFETNYDAEKTLNESYKYEFRQRSNGNPYNAQALIVKEVYLRNKIRKEQIFSLSKGLRDCVVAAYAMFSRPTDIYKQKIERFNKAAKLAVKAHNDAIARETYAVFGQ